MVSTSRTSEPRQSTASAAAAEPAPSCIGPSSNTPRSRSEAARVSLSDDVATVAGTLGRSIGRARLSRVLVAGADPLARTVAEACRFHGAAVEAFATTRVSEPGARLDGIPIVHPQALSEENARNVAGVEARRDGQFEAVMKALPAGRGFRRVLAWRDGISFLRRDTSGRRAGLVFVVGKPRSGTTWLLSLLEAHPDCHALAPGTLGIAVQRPTKETGLLLRGLSDEEIVGRVAGVDSERVLVEKTPGHLLEIPRIRALFPGARLVLVRRDPLDVVNSLLQPNRFWSKAPKTLDEAVALYRRFDRAEQAYGDYDHVVQYEQLWGDPVGEAARLFDALGLSPDAAEATVAATHYGRSLPTVLAGVFREGTPGGGIRRFALGERRAILTSISTPTFPET